VSKDTWQDGHQLWRDFVNEVTQIAFKRKLIKDVYSEKGIEIINQTHSNWFARVQRILIDDLILSVMRLLDPDSTGKYENFSLNYITKNAGDCIDQSHHEEISQLIDDADEVIKRIKDHRDKRIAHADLRTAQCPMQLPSINFQDIECVIFMLQRIANMYSMHLNNGPIEFEDMIDHRSGKLVISCLELGISAYSLINLVNKIKYQHTDRLSYDESKIKPLIFEMNRMGYRPRSD